MTVDEKVQAVLIASGDLTAQVSAERIKTPGDWQGLSVPYIVHQPAVPGRVTRTHVEGLQALRQWDFYEVAVYARTHGEARQIGDLVVSALDGYRDEDVDLIALGASAKAAPFDGERKVASVVLDFEIAGALT